MRFPSQKLGILNGLVSMSQGIIYKREPALDALLVSIPAFLLSGSGSLYRLQEYCIFFPPFL